MFSPSPPPVGVLPGELPPGTADLLRLVLYFDVFRHPVRPQEAAWMCGGSVDDRVRAAVDAGLLQESQGFLVRPGRLATIQRRRERTAHAERLWPAAMRAARVLARLPFVHGVFLTGGLSKQSSEPGGDADFLLLVEPGCVWTTKTGLQVVRRVLPEAVRRLFCTNYLLSTDALVLDDQDVYTGFELATAIPLAGASACTAFLAANGWSRRWIPGLDWAVERAKGIPPGPRAPSALAVAARTMDQRLQGRWDRLWDEKYRWLPEDVRARRFKRSSARATNHLHDFRGFVVAEYRSRCLELGVDPLQEAL